MIGFLIGLAILAVAWRVYARLKGQKSPIIQHLESDMSQAFKDAFAAYQAFRDKQEADAVAAATAAAQASQEQLDAAHAAGVQAESDEDTATVTAAMPAV